MFVERLVDRKEGVAQRGGRGVSNQNKARRHRNAFC
jgi:hypothetical protein